MCRCFGIQALPMCDALKFQKARSALHRLQSAVAKHNASIRVRYPCSHNIRKIIENTLSGTVNDMPFSIQIFARSGEDAACLCDVASFLDDPLDIFTEGMSDLIDEARKWAGEPILTVTGVAVYPKSISIVEKHLFMEIECSARNFFNAIYASPHVHSKPFHKA